MRTLTRGTRGWLALAFIVVACVAVSAGVFLTRPDSHLSRKAQSLALCRKALGNDVATSGLVTVGWVRDYSTGGPGPATDASHPFSDAFAGSSAQDVAAWCWTGSPARWTFFGVNVTGEKVVLGVMDDAPVAPDGPLARLVPASGGSSHASAT